MLSRVLLFLLILFLPVSLSAQGVVSAAEPRAAEAGREILRAGGSATDAAMAMMLALTVVEPQSSGIGGGGFLLHQSAGGDLQTIDGRETAPASAGTTRFLDASGKPLPFIQAWPGGYSVGVPGNIRLMAAAHEKWGKLAWRRLFEPAIRLADKGFTVSPRLAQSIARMGPIWKDFPAIRSIYWDKAGQPLKAGATIRNPALAGTLRTIARQGPDALYRGAVGRSIAAAVAAAPRNPTQLTMADLAAYQAKQRPPVCAPYRSYRICGMGPPSSGATTVLQILGMLERFDMKALGPRNVRSWHLIAEAMKLAYADREKWLGDQDLVSVQVAGLIDRD
jgi:gamma-glutamyltranspeptidase/glutathione hydrolase